jgi:Mitosis protein DIM1
MSLICGFGRSPDQAQERTGILFDREYHSQPRPYDTSSRSVLWLQVTAFNAMYELYDPCTIMFFFRNKHIMIDLGTGNNNKINWAMTDKQEFIDIVETVYRGARKGRGLVVSPKGVVPRSRSRKPLMCRPCGLSCARACPAMRMRALSPLFWSTRIKASLVLRMLERLRVIEKRVRVVGHQICVRPLSAPRAWLWHQGTLTVRSRAADYSTKYRY